VTVEDLQAHPEGVQYKAISHRKYQQNPFPTPSGKLEFSSAYLKSLGYPALPEYLEPLYRRENSGGRGGASVADSANPSGPTSPVGLGHVVGLTNPADYPFVLITGARKSVYCHSRFRNIERFLKLHPRAEVELHPNDAVQLGVNDDDEVRIESEVGVMVLPVRVLEAEDTCPGLVQITHGWEQRCNVNQLTYDQINDPISGFPQLTSVPVRIEKV
jgi:anaerobic selenocysteine-containing dehydrogenase